MASELQFDSLFFVACLCVKHILNFPAPHTCDAREDSFHRPGDLKRHTQFGGCQGNSTSVRLGGGGAGLGPFLKGTLDASANQDQDSCCCQQALFRGGGRVTSLLC